MHILTLKAFSKKEVIVLSSMWCAEEMGHPDLIDDYSTWIDRLNEVDLSAKPVLMLLNGKSLDKISREFKVKKSKAKTLVLDALKYHPVYECFNKD